MAERALSLVEEEFSLQEQIATSWALRSLSLAPARLPKPSAQQLRALSLRHLAQAAQLMEAQVVQPLKLNMIHSHLFSEHIIVTLH